MRINRERVAAVLAAVIAASVGMQAAEATTVFSDNLTASSSTVGAASTPTGGNTTSYDIASAKNSSTVSITTSGLGLTLPSSSSAIVEAQALFSGSPITLSSVGDKIELTVTFNVKAGTPIAAYFGMYNSGGVKPFTDLANGGMNSSLSADATGGAQMYLGYVANVQNGTTSSKIQSRPSQAGTTNTNQDLLSAGASGSQSYTGAITLGSSTAPVTPPLATGGTYTEDFLITVTAASSGGTPIQYSLDSNLFSGTSATGTALVSTHGVDPVTSAGVTSTFGYNSFDALAFGFRENNSVISEVDYSSVTVSTNVVQQQLLDGDANGDNHVDLNDLNIVLNNLGVTSSKRSDGNFDGAPTIDLNDLNEVLNHLGTSLTPATAQQVAEAQAAAAVTAAPEPASLALLTVGGIMMLKRRKGASQGR